MEFNVVGASTDTMNAFDSEIAQLKTNIKDLEKYPRNENSMPGKYPGKVVKVYHENCMADNKPDLKAAKKMQNEGMLRLTGKKNIKKAWRQLWRVSTMKTPCPIW
jgi:hypothetical protein